MSNEKMLLSEYVAARVRVDELSDELKDAKDKLNVAQHNLYNYMEENEIGRTASHDGMGFVTLSDDVNPRAYVLKEYEMDLLDYLRNIGRDDMIRETVHHMTLNTFVKQALEEGHELPEFIKMSPERKMRFYRDGIK